MSGLTPDLYVLETLLLLVVTAVACALPGVFLVLRRLALLSDAIGHAMLLGIVLGFFVTESLTSPLLIAGAALTGLVTVVLVELLHRTQLVREDAAIGLVFPALFSVAILLISTQLRNVHLDKDSVLLGKPGLATFHRLEIGTLDLGPQGLWVMGVILLLNLGFIALFYKELKLATFDAALAAALGFAPALLHYGLMALVSVTVVGAFESVGAILVVALMIGPAAAAYLLADRLSHVLLWSAALGAAAAVLGYGVLARWLNVSIAGSVATMTGVLFGLAFLLAPERGLLASVRRRLRQRYSFAETMLTIHLLHHEGRPEAAEESAVAHLHEHLRWQPAFVTRVVYRAERHALVEEQDGQLTLTPAGRELAQRVMTG